MTAVRKEGENKMTTVTDFFAAGLEQVRKSWGWFLVFGILLAILGVICVLKAQTATKFSILALGWVLAISGVLWLINAFRAFNWHGFFLYLLNGIIRMVTGYLLLRHPDAGAAGVTMALASLFIVGGLFRIVGASTIQFPRWGWTVLSGLVSVFLGVFLLTTWPSASTYFVGMAIGIDLIFDGAALLGFAGAIHSLPKAQVRAA
jgi:uncharacterized membrane protein HdeD (DUF308 family)